MVISIGFNFFMLEILVIILGFLLMYGVDVFYVRLFILCIVFALVLPGFYAMIAGAPFVPSLKKAVKSILSLGNFSKKDVVVELGCGDGRIIRKIAAIGVKQALGYEYSFPTFLYARFLSLFFGKGEVIVFADIWKQTYSEADVLVLFLLDNSMKKFEKEIWPTLKSGTRVISNSFRIPGHKPLKVKDSVYLYVKN